MTFSIVNGPPPHESRFSVGSPIRVRKGILDPNYDDLPLGGWAGVVRELEVTTGKWLYLVVWSRETLAAAHPVYRRRCEHDGYDHEENWLAEEDLEPDPGGPVTLEQPTKRRPQPLDDDIPEDFARKLFGLTSDDELPTVGAQSLAKFHKKLRARMRFPFQASLDGEPVRVLRLHPFDPEDEEECLKVEVFDENRDRLVIPLQDLEWDEDIKGARELGAYLAWLEETDSLPAEESPVTSRSPEPDDASPEDFEFGSVTYNLLLCLAAAILVTAWIASDSGGGWGVLICAGIGGIILGSYGSRRESLFWRMMGQPPRIAYGLTGGIVGGGILGAALGVSLHHYRESLIGVVVGAILELIMALRAKSRPYLVKACCLGAFLGGMSSLYSANGAQTLIWGGVGFLGGLILVTANVFAMKWYVTAAMNQMIRNK